MLNAQVEFTLEGVRSLGLALTFHTESKTCFQIGKEKKNLQGKKWRNNGDKISFGSNILENDGMISKVHVWVDSEG